jgi:hypothetical protein
MPIKRAYARQDVQLVQFVQPHAYARLCVRRDIRILYAELYPSPPGNSFGKLSREG